MLTWTEKNKLFLYLNAAVMTELPFEVKGYVSGSDSSKKDLVVRFRYGGYAELLRLSIEKLKTYVVCKSGLLLVSGVSSEAAAQAIVEQEASFIQSLAKPVPEEPEPMVVTDDSIVMNGLVSATWFKADLADLAGKNYRDEVTKAKAYLRALLPTSSFIGRIVLKEGKFDNVKFPFCLK